MKYKVDTKKSFDWNAEKNERLRRERGVSFSDFVKYIKGGKLLDVIVHPNSKKYPNQKIFIINGDDQVYLIPFVEDEKKYFLKTIFADRRYTKKYIDNQNEKNRKKK